MVAELQSVKLNCLNDNQTQTCKKETDELTLLTCATLEEIMKELKRKGCLDGMNEEDLVVAAYGKEDKDCCSEMRRLQAELDKVKKQLEGAANCEDLCADALKRLKELEAENAKLLQENNGLKNKLKESEEKLAEMLKKVENLGNELNKCRQEAQQIGKDLDGTKGLVKEISDVQFKNQQMTNAVSAINSRDDQKIIDDLRRQLEEELAKLRKCQQDNAKLQELIEQREKELNELRDLNKKLGEENAKLLAEKEKLIAENEKLIAENKKLVAEKEKLMAENEKLIAENKKLVAEKEKLIAENEKLIAENGKLIAEKEKLIAENKKLIAEKEKLTAEMDKLIKEQQGKDQDDGKSKSKIGKPPDDITKVTKRPTKVTNEITKDDGKTTPGRTEDVRDKDIPPPKKAAALFETDKPAALFETDKPAASPKPKDKAAALDKFVKEKSDSFQSNLQKGRGFEKELRKILEEFIRECGFCFCRLVNPKSKLYSICHKLYHCGLNTLSFRELAYLHKKIFARAEELVPGCLLDMILSENKEKVESMLCTIMPRLDGGCGAELDCKISDSNVTDMDPKCCCCKNELCCNNSDEMLKDKG